MKNGNLVLRLSLPHWFLLSVYSQDAINHGSSSKGSTGSSMDGTYVSSDGIFTLIISGASCTFITSVSGRSVTQNGTIDKYYRTNSSFGSQAYKPGYWETWEYTAYKNEVEYYTVPNPNYNPTAVANAKKNLQGWESVKNSAKVTLAKLTLPFVLEVYQASTK